jgi:hypothetical protein
MRDSKSHLIHEDLGTTNSFKYTLVVLCMLLVDGVLGD